MKNLNAIDWVSLVLTIIGGLNWGLVGFFGFNLVEAIFGEMSAASRVVYALVGISAVYLIFVSPMFAKHPVSQPRRAAHQI